MPDFLDVLCFTAQKTVASGYYTLMTKSEPVNPVVPVRLSKHVRKCTCIPLIAEIKVTSPTVASRRNHVDAGETGRCMEAGGAAGISVVTEPRFFQGTPRVIQEVRSRVALPLLMKDFIVSPAQIQAARAAGANAILFIQQLFDRGYAADGLAEMIEFAHVAELEVLLETHTKAEFERALQTEADLIGINNRDLRTLDVNLATTRDILEQVPADGRIVVSESGVVTPADVRFLRRCGADALLVGSRLMRAENVREAVETLVMAL